MDLSRHVTKCKRCGRSIVFAETGTGAQIPLDARVTIYIVQPSGDGLKAKRAVDRDDAVLLVSHFATCPFAAEFSGKNRKR